MRSGMHTNEPRAPPWHMLGTALLRVVVLYEQTSCDGRDQLRRAGAAQARKREEAQQRQLAAPACPAMLAVHRVTARTLNTA